MQNIFTRVKVKIAEGVEQVASSRETFRSLIEFLVFLSRDEGGKVFRRFSNFSRFLLLHFFFGIIKNYLFFMEIAEH